MTTRKPKVGDAALIDGGPAEISAVTAEYVEFKCPERIAFEARIAELRAMPTGTEEAAAVANAAKEKFRAEHEAKMPPLEERARLVSHGHALPGGTVTKASPKQVFWVAYSEAWSCHGRLLPRLSRDGPAHEPRGGHAADIRTGETDSRGGRPDGRRRVQNHAGLGSS